MTRTAPVAVIIAARNAADRVGAAVRSAIMQSAVAEIILVDDASSDGTADAALDAAEGSDRLSVVRLDVNRGPATARNIAIAASSAPFIAMLDADDQFAPGRLEALLRWRDFEMMADNILFVSEDSTGNLAPSAVTSPDDHAPAILRLPEFVRGNISQRGASRGELGFLKPVLSRQFLQRHGLRYNEQLRLGEDYELYTRMLAHGARFGVVQWCGYVATERASSLSGRHSTSDLAALASADDALLRLPSLDQSSRRAISAHRRHVLTKWRHRLFLDDKRRLGLAGALARQLSQPTDFVRVAGAIARDKAVSWRTSTPPTEAVSRQLLRRV